MAEEHDLTAARKNARTKEDAAAIAWAQDEIERLSGLLNDAQYIRMKAAYARGELSWANMINEREARKPRRAKEKVRG